MASVCDASFTTFMFTHWVKGRTRGERIALEEVVRMQTSEPAHLYGMTDRGVIAPGLKADLNIIDLDNLKLLAPYTAFDLPAGGKRMLQKAEGLSYTLVSGEVIFKDGECTTARPGKIVRGGQAARRPQEGARASQRSTEIRIDKLEQARAWLSLAQLFVFQNIRSWPDADLIVSACERTCGRPRLQAGFNGVLISLRQLRRSHGASSSQRWVSARPGASKRRRQQMPLLSLAFQTPD